MTGVAVFVDPSCPWAWITSRWVKDVALQRDLVVTWRSYCLEIRDDYGVAPTVAEQYREMALAGHALSHRMLRIFEAARARAGEDAVDAVERRIDVVLPIAEFAIRILGEQRWALSWAAKLPELPSAHALDVGTDKGKLAEFLDRYRIAHPPTVVVTAGITALDRLSALRSAWSLETILQP